MGIFEANPKAALDDQLMAQVAQGDHHALQTLYDLTRRGIYGFALSITGHYADAEDVTQETYLRAYQAAVAGQYQAMGKPMAWLMTIARNLARMKLREGSRSAGLDEEALTRLPAPASLDAEDKMVLGRGHGRPHPGRAPSGHAPRFFGTQAPGNCPFAGYAPFHRPFQIPPRAVQAAQKIAGG